MRTRCRRAALVPEYAFGIPGSFKNALDWTVGSGSLYRKPVTLLNVAPPGRGEHVRAALELVFQALDADVAYYTLPLAASDRDARGEVSDPRFINELRAVVGELVERATRPGR